jgi:hypothetical protein
MIVSGYTDSRLNEVSTYSKTQPYQIGVNGVTDIFYDDNNEVSTVFYIIDNISYTTTIGTPILPGVFANQTTYLFSTSGLTEENINVIKNEVEMGIAFPPKIESDIFIERQTTSVFERHLRMEEITTLDQLEEYKNGYYTIFNLEK